MLDMDIQALNERYGVAKDIDDFFRKAQLQVYEAKVTMLEAYGKKLYKYGSDSMDAL